MKDSFPLTDLFPLILLGCFVVLMGFFRMNELFIFNETYDIYSIDLKNKSSGSFIFGIGNIRSEPVYYLYTVENGTYQLKNISANDTKIKMDCDENPTLTVKKQGLIIQIESYELCLPSDAIQIDYKMNSTE